MRHCVKTELWKAFHSKSLLYALILGFVIQAFNLVYNLSYIPTVLERSAAGANVGQAVSLFLRWISVDGWTLGYNLLVILFPLLATLPFGWSLFTEAHSHYQNQILIRKQKWQYYCAKYIATFISGGIVIGVTLLINLLLNALICPAVPVNSYAQTVEIGPAEMLSKLYYTNPWLHSFIWIGISFLWGGVLSAFCLFSAQIVRKRIFAVLLPFALLLLMDFVLPASWSPAQYLLISSFTNHQLSTLIIMLVLFGVVGFVGGWVLYSKRETL